MAKVRKFLAGFLDSLDDDSPPVGVRPTPTPKSKSPAPAPKPSKEQFLEDLAQAPDATPDPPAPGKRAVVVPFEPLPQRNTPRTPLGTFKRGDVCFYRGERFFIEYAPQDWSHGHYARVSDSRVDPNPDRPTNDKRLTFCVHVDTLEVAPQPRHTHGKLPTKASAARSERAAAGVRDVGDRTAELLREAKTPDDLYRIGAKALGVPAQELRDKYAHLNPGQQRMNIGNRIRAKFKKEYRHGR